MKVKHLTCCSFLYLIFFFAISEEGVSQIDLSKPVGTTAGQAGATATGGVSYTIPIDVLKGTNGMEPKVNLAYNSQGGEGIAGFGWNLSVNSLISRQGKRQYYDGSNSPVNYNNTNDEFLLDGQHLFPVTGTNGANGTVYGTENESYSKIESFGGSVTNGPDWFKVTTRDGMILEYGTDVISKVLTDNGQSVMFWLLRKVTDKSGNYQEYKYSINQTDRDFALTEIDYTGNINTGQLPYNKIEFLYTVLPNWQNRKIFEGGSKLTSPFLLDKINIKNINGIVVRKYQCSYTAIKNQSFLSSFTETGSDGTILNPLTFQYGSNTGAQDVSVSLQYSGFAGNNTYTGEVTGDGKEDVISAEFYYDNNNIPHYTKYYVFDDLGSYGGQPAISLAYQYNISQTGSATDVQRTFSGYKGFLTSDYDGDSKADVLMVSNFITTTTRTFDGIKINYSRNYTTYSSTYQTVSYPQIPHVTAYVNDFKYIYNQGSYFIPGDFDGDGKQDYILILGLNTTNSFKAFFSSPAKNIVNQEIVSFGVGGNPSDPFYATTVASTSGIIPIDFDGDGKMEILVQKPGSSYILSVFPVSPSTGYNYAASVLYTFNNIITGYRIFPGDFNGDGKTDLLVRSSANSAYAAWNILYSTGTQYLSYPFIFQNRPYLDGDNGGSAHHLLIADFNGDGKTDIWHSMDQTTSSSIHTMYISNGVPLDNGNSATAFTTYNYSSPTSINRNQAVQSVFGDFNFDGKPDIFSINGTTAKIIYPKPLKEDNLMVSTTNGLGAQTSFYYSQGYNRSAAYQYDNPSTPLGQGANGNPYTVLKTPMYVVNTLAEPNGLGGSTYINTVYEDAMYHPLRGFLGFKKVTSYHGATATNSIAYSEMNATFLIPLIYRSTTDQYGSLLTENLVTNNLIRINPGNYFDKRFVSQVAKNTSFNYVTGSGNETTNTYDNYGNITNATVKGGPFSGVIVTGLETVTSAATYVSSFTPVPSLPSTTTLSKTRTGQSTVNKTTTYTYNSKGLVASVTDFSGTAIANTLSYTYDNFGNVATQTLSAPSTPVVSNTYDSKGRYLLSKSTSGSGITKTETFSYNALNDHISTATSSDALTTTFNYDGFGNVTSTLLPDGNTIVSPLAWETTTGRYSRTSYRSADGGIWNKKYFDIIGREIRSEAKGFNDQLIFSTTQYNTQGLVYKQAQPRYASEPLVEITNSYDQLQRLTSVTNGSTTSNYSYSLVAGGLYTTTVTNGASQASSKTMDASGKEVKTIDNGGQLDFTYDSWGNQKDVKFGATSLVVNTYDSYGRQITLTDKNAGTITYQYNTLGKLTQQKDAKNNTHTFVYDAFGRLLTKTGPAGTTTYTYYSVAGKVNDNITSITGFAGDVKTYQYDNLQRLISEITNVSGQSFTKTLQYNAYGNLIKTTYPSGVIINDTYDKNNILTLTSMTNAGVTQTLFTATAMNSRGVYTGYSYGNGKTSSVTYDLTKGVPTRYYTQGIQDLNFNFDTNTGNLLSRQEAIKGLTETFTYDNLNRLKSAAVNTVQQFAMTYDGSSSSSLGNIQSKSDIGNYRYDAQKIHELRFLTTNSGVPTNPPNIISPNTQAITYTPFLKTATIAENGYQIAYTYGEDEQRIKSVLTQNGTTLETKYYLGVYEKQIKGAVTREIHYISAGNGLCAIVIKEAGVVTPYFVYSDHLGSLLTITNSAGTVVAEQNFDAWGRYRNPTNWMYNSVPVNPDWLYRGFTGHEHVKQFALINMNGRMYDPVTCRMLSPDNYVQQPFYTQNYNRYSYVLNNPLKYSDPSGQYVVVDSWIKGFFSGLFKGGLKEAWKEANNRAANDAKIWGGLFTGNFKQILSRFTWELPQTLLGFGYSHFSNTTLGNVNDVNYYDGATVVRHNKKNGLGVTLGSYINGDNSIRPDPNNSLFQHEYGHYLQSRASGIFYLPKFAIPSLLSRNNGNHPAVYNAVEQDANIRGIEYFFKKTNGSLDWHFDDNPIGTDGRSWTMAEYHSIDFQEILYRGRMGVNFADIFLGWPTLGIYNTIVDNKKY